MKKKTITAVVALAIACVATGFTTVPHKINYDLNDGSVEEILPDHANFWQAISLPDVTKIHEIFTGWIDENNESVSEIKFTANDISLKAGFVPEYYSVRLMNEDGSVATTTMRKYGQTTDLMKFDAKSISDTHPYEDIVGWTDKYHNATITTISAECARDVELYPVFEPKKYSISYELNGGTNASNPETYKYGTGIESFADPYRDGYTFTGWFSDPECTSQVTSISADSHDDITLYAKWNEITSQTYVPTYYVSNSSQGNTGSSGSSTNSGHQATTSTTGPVDPNNYISIPAIGYTMSFQWNDSQSVVDSPYYGALDDDTIGYALVKDSAGNLRVENLGSILEYGDHNSDGLGAASALGAGNVVYLTINGVTYTYTISETYTCDGNFGYCGNSSPRGYGGATFTDLGIPQRNSLILLTCTYDNTGNYVIFCK